MSTRCSVAVAKDILRRRHRRGFISARGKAQSFSNISATTAALSVNSTAGDFSANGTSAVLYLPPKQFRFTIATATGVYCYVCGVPDPA
jgi:hypothetical protein